MEKYQNINILYEDNHLLVVTKPANMPVCLDNSNDIDLLTKLKEYIKNKQNAFLITMEIEGKQLSSEEFANKLQVIEQDGYYNEILFLIGGAYGLEQDVRNKSNFKFSMSKLTFLHQEAVLILMEQIYRAYKILNNEPYHK